VKKIVIVLALVALLIVPVACGPRTSESPPADQSGLSVPGVAPGGEKWDYLTPPMVTAPPSNGSSGSSDTSTATDQMIVRTANMSLVVEDVAGSIDRISNLAKANDGYVVTSGVWRNNEQIYGNISIRVAVGKFDAAISALRGLATKVVSETTSSKDVTEEYVDLEAKLRTLEATETQLLALMQKAEKIEDILAIQRELTRVQSEIEQTKGRMQYLERTSSSSLIEISLQESKLAIKFTASSNTIKTGENIRFTPEVSGGFTPYSYAWDFGDGITSTDQSPVHSYQSRGNYTVTLKVTDDQGNTSDLVRDNYITVIGGWSPGSIANGAWHALGSFGRGLVNVIIVLGIWSFLWLPVGAIVWWLIWRRKKKAAR